MTTRRVLCGWVNFEERVASHDALAAMLAAEGLGLPDVQVQASEIGMIASTQPACSAATDLGAGCMAVVLGRPRWQDAALRARAGSALDCLHCTTLWCAAPAALWLADGWPERAVWWLALSAAAIGLDELLDDRRLQRWVGTFLDQRSIQHASSKS